MAWITSRSVPATSWAEAAYSLLVTLLAAGWTCTGSGDGLSLVSAGNCLTGGAAVGAGSLLNPRAWFKVRVPGGTEELCVQHVSSGTNYRVKRARLALTGGVPTSALVPSGATERVILGSGTDASPSGSAWFSNTPSTCRYWCRANAVAPFEFWAAAFPVGGGTPFHGLAFDPVTPPEAEGDPVVWYAAGSSAWDASTLGSTTWNSLVYGDVPAASPTVGTTWAAVRPYAQGSALYPHVAAPTISGADSLYPITWERLASEPNPGRKGASTLFAWVGPVRSTGTYHDLPSAPASRVVIGSVSLPNDGVEAPI